MPVDFSTGNTTGLTRAPRIINVGDPTGGCPTASRSNPMMTMTFTVAVTSVVIIEGEIIRRRDGNGRCDAELWGPGYPNISSDSYVGNVRLDYTLDYNDARDFEWDNTCLRWAGYVPAGTHTFYVNYVGCASSWGCTSPWGQLNAMIFE